MFGFTRNFRSRVESTQPYPHRTAAKGQGSPLTVSTHSHIHHRASPSVHVIVSPLHGVRQLLLSPPRPAPPLPATASMLLLSTPLQEPVHLILLFPPWRRLASPIPVVYRVPFLHKSLDNVTCILLSCHGVAGPFICPTISRTTALTPSQCIR